MSVILMSNVYVNAQEGRINDFNDKQLEIEKYLNVGTPKGVLFGFQDQKL